MCHVKLVLDTVLMQRSCSKAPSMMIAAPFRPTYHNAMAMIIAAAYMQLHTCQAAAGCPLPGRSLLHSAVIAILGINIGSSLDELPGAGNLTVATGKVQGCATLIILLILVSTALQ